MNLICTGIKNIRLIVLIIELKPAGRFGICIIFILHPPDVSRKWLIVLPGLMAWFFHNEILQPNMADVQFLLF